MPPRSSRLGDAEDFGPEFDARNVENYGSNIKVISNKKNLLKCGIKAIPIDIKWSPNNSIWMTVSVVSAYYDEKCIYHNHLKHPRQ